MTDPNGYMAINAVCAAIRAIAGWVFGDYVAQKLGYSSGFKYWAIRAGVVVGGTVIGWFAGAAIAKLVKAFVVANPAIKAKLSAGILKALGIGGSEGARKALNVPSYVKNAGSFINWIRSSFESTKQELSLSQIKQLINMANTYGVKVSAHLDDLLGNR